MTRRRVYRVILTSGLLLGVMCVCLAGIAWLLREPLRQGGYGRRLFGATYMTMDNPYFEILNTSLKELIEARGDRLITRDPANSQSKQNSQILDMLDAGVQLLFINPVNCKTISPALEICHDKGIPFIIVDTGVELDEYAACTIVSDNYQAGKLIATDLLGKRQEARIVVLYDQGIKATNLRLQGFLDALDAVSFPYRIVYTAGGATLLHETMVEMQKFLSLDLDFDVVFGGNDPAALGALAAIENNHRGQGQLIYGIDGSPSGKLMVRQGKLEATAAQFPSQLAHLAVEAAYTYLDGGTIEHSISIPTELVTKSTADAFPLTGWQ